MARFRVYRTSIRYELVQRTVQDIEEGRAMAEKRAGCLRSLGKLVAIGVAVFIGIIWIGVRASRNRPVDARSSVPAVQQPARRVLKPGDDVVVEMGPPATDKTTVVLAADEAAFDALTRALNAKDELGALELVNDGRAFMIFNGARAKLLDRGLMRSRVRVLEGSQAGKAGWLATEFVR